MDSSQGQDSHSKLFGKHKALFNGAVNNRFHLCLGGWVIVLMQGARNIFHLEPDG